MGFLSRQAPRRMLLFSVFCSVTVMMAEFTDMFLPTVVLGVTLCFTVLSKRVPFVRVLRLSC